MLGTRAKAQEASYSMALPDPETTPLAERIARLAEVRTAEGYLAEAVAEPDGAMLLVEHHCPIADAARSCSGFCQSELELFRRVLGDDVVVERTQHLMAGDQRCAYRVRPVGTDSGDAARSRPSRGTPVAVR